MSKKKSSLNNRFHSNVFKDVLEDLLNLIASKRNFIIAGSILSLGIALGSGLETDRYAEKWLENEITEKLDLDLTEIEGNKKEQIANLEEKLKKDLAETNTLIEIRENELANEYEKIDLGKSQKLQANERIRQNIRKEYENKIEKINAELDERVRKAVEQETGRPYPLGDDCWFWDNECKDSKRRYKDLKPDVALQIKKDVALKEKELEQELKRNSNFEQTDEEINTEAENKKASLEAIYKKDIKKIQKDQDIFKEEFKTQEEIIVQKAILDKNDAEKRITKDINQKFRSTTINVSQISAIAGSIFGAMTTIFLLLLLAEYVFLKSAISEKIWFQRYKSFVLKLWLILLIGCAISISLKLFIATDPEKEHITEIAIPTAGIGASISAIASLLSSGFLIYALRTSKNPGDKKRQIVSGEPELKFPIREKKSDEIKI